MARILVVDAELKILDDYKKALWSINPDFKLFCYTSFYQMEEFYKTLKPEEQSEYYKFDLSILDYGLMKPNDWEGRLSDLKIKADGETTICFSAYDNASVNRKYILSLHIFNILYKPFDQLILKESLNLALRAKKKSQPIEMKAQSTKALVALLKEIELISLCELGFVTLNEGAVAVNSYSKYFSELFTSGKKQSIWAQCILSVPLPGKPNYFINKFQFVGIDAGGLMNLRKYLQTNKQKRSPTAVWNLTAPKTARTVYIALIDTKDDKAAVLKKDIEGRFKNVSVDFVRVEPGKASEVSTTNYDCIINMNPELKFDDFKNRFKKDSLYLIVCREALAEEKLKELAANYRDIYTHPFDKSYFFKKLKVFVTDLNYVEAVELINITTPEKLKAASLVQISEICELYVNFNYHRELPNGSFREFAFINDDENQIVELPGFCSYTEKSARLPNQKKDAFFHQFIFWGMTDHYLKQIRIWLLQNHINQNKDKNS